jgi:branched-subunit amino acid aminotransferase/4-amino-4-deoxychorismate lyase
LFTLPRVAKIVLLQGSTMTMPTAYLNGTFLPADRLFISVTDQGFVQGVTVAEQLRTFGGRLFRLEQHLARLARSLNIIGVEGISADELTRVAHELVAKNYPLLSAGDDLGLSIFITPGPYSTFASSGYSPPAGPTLGLHTYALPFHLFASKYDTGEALVVTEIQQVPAACWPVELKCRSRMHYYLADKAAREQEAGARALMLDDAGFVTEASTANLLVYYRNVGLVSPPLEKILPGVSVATLKELAANLAIPFSYRDLTVDDVAAADEVLLCSTSPCVWSVTRLNGRPIANGTPGAVVAQLQSAWSELVGFNIVAQAKTQAAGK